jgi:hypothetical protein
VGPAWEPSWPAKGIQVHVLICAACCRAVPQQAASDGRLELECWICDRAVDVFQG